MQVEHKALPTHLGCLSRDTGGSKNNQKSSTQTFAQVTGSLCSIPTHTRELSWFVKEQRYNRQNEEWVMQGVIRGTEQCSSDIM